MTIPKNNVLINMTKKRKGCKPGEIQDHTGKCIPIAKWMPWECTPPKNSKALPIVRKYVGKKLIDGGINWDEDIDAEYISLQNILSLKPNQGNMRKFLKELKKAGYSDIELDHPRETALPFWKKMYKEGLITDNPFHLETWEEATNE
jgi:hypothetical protein